MKFPEYPMYNGTGCAFCVPVTRKELDLVTVASHIVQGTTAKALNGRLAKIRF